MAWLFAAAKPRLSALAMSRTAGKRVRTISALPSSEPLSTTTVSMSSPAPLASIELRHSARSSRVFQLMTMTSTVATTVVHSAKCGSFSPEPCPSLPRRHDAVAVADRVVLALQGRIGEVATRAHVYGPCGDDGAGDPCGAGAVGREERIDQLDVAPLPLDVLEI